jgi:hypothetical protein
MTGELQVRRVYVKITQRFLNSYIVRLSESKANVKKRELFPFFRESIASRFIQVFRSHEEQLLIFQMQTFSCGWS